MGATEGHARVSNTQTLQAVVFTAYISFVLCTAGVFQTTNCSSLQCVPISSALGQSYPLLLQSRVICITCLFVCVREDLLEHRYSLISHPRKATYQPIFFFSFSDVLKMVLRVPKSKIRK